MAWDGILDIRSSGACWVVTYRLCNTSLLGRGLADERDGLLHRYPKTDDFRDADFLKFVAVLLENEAADEDKRVFKRVVCFQPIVDLRNERVMRLKRMEMPMTSTSSWTVVWMSSSGAFWSPE